MRVSSTLIAAAAAAGTLLLAGCADQAPTGVQGPALSTTSVSTSGSSTTSGTTIVSSTGTSGTSTVSFTIYPSTRATITINEHRIAFEPNAVCDPARSTYGTTEWDKPCTLATGGVQITAKSYRDASGKPVVDFQPALRFNPASRVTLYLLDRASAADPNYRILWTNPQGALVDESLTDPSVVTRADANGYKYRRIKHFSGYIISASRTGTTSGAE